MLYRPPAHLRMWDTWMFREKAYLHLFSLTSGYEYPGSPNTLPWDRVIHVVSDDWIHWEERPEILLQESGNPEAWDAGCILTGSTFRTPDGYAMTYGAVHAGREKIGVLTSSDLDAWQKHPQNPVLCPGGSWYETTCEMTAQATVPWRDAWVMPNDDGYEAIICAGDADVAKSANGCVARVTSPDLCNWTYHPPMASPERYLDMEVPQYIEWNGWHYLLFSTSGMSKSQHLPSRQRVTGTFYLMSQAKYGPYHAPDDNLLLGAGEGRIDNYVGKILVTDEGPLLYHHLCGYRTAFAAPKVVKQSPDGRLSLERWPGLDRLLEDETIGAASSGRRLVVGGRWPIGEWRAHDDALTGEAGVAMSGWVFDQPVQDFGCRCRIDLAHCARAGVLFRLHKSDPQGDKGWAVSLDRARGRVELCRPKLGGRTPLGLEPLDVVYGSLPAECLLEFMVRDSYVEIYVNHRPLFVLNTSLVTATDHLVSGQVGLFVEHGAACFRDLSVRDIPVPLP